MSFDKHFHVVSRSPGSVTVIASQFSNGVLTTAEARKMGEHLIRICDIVDAAEKTLVKNLRAQPGRN